MDLELIQESISHLEKLAGSLGVEVTAAPGQKTEVSPVALKSKEALLTISILLPKLRAIRGAALDPLLERRCAHCDE